MNYMLNKILIIVNISISILLFSILYKTVFVTDFHPKNNLSHYLEKQTLFDNLPSSTNTIFFLGDSLTNGCEWNELLANPKIKNRGINGDTTEGVLNRLNQLTKSKPQKIFIMIGINDLFNNIESAKILENYQKIITTIKTDSPKTKIYIQSILPMNFELDKNKRPINNQNILDLNNNLKNLSNNSTVFYIDLYPAFLDSSGQLNPQYTLDGLHLTGQGYLIWKEKIIEYIN